MNIKQMKSMISKFRSADVSLIKDAEMRAKAQKMQNKQGGFTLLELLVVVAILAIIAGAVISSLDGQEELAAQKTTVHTMAALEEGFAIYNATSKRVLPGNLDSLLCNSTVDASAATAALGTVTAATSTKLGGLSNVARVGGGMTADLAGGLELVDAPQGAVNTLADAGLTSLRYVEGTACDTQTASILPTTGINEELVEVTKPNLIFRAPLIEGGDWEFGAGVPLDLSTYVADTSTDAVPMLFLEEPAEITNNESDVVAVFGIGPDSDIIGEIVKRAPSDGNGGPDKYSNFSVAVKIAQCTDGSGNLTEAEDGFDSGDGCDSANWEYVSPEVVAVLDAGGDAYDDEVAEARGNEEE
jgi:prepilin-type N-terminal cleavage/methylation domain-containing protein